MAIGRIRPVLAAGATAALLAGGVVTAITASAAPACGSGSFNAEASLSGSTWTSRNGGRTVYTGTDMRAAMQSALDSLTAGRRSAQRVVGNTIQNLTVRNTPIRLSPCGSGNVIRNVTRVSSALTWC